MFCKIMIQKTEFQETLCGLISQAVVSEETENQSYVCQFYYGKHTLSGINKMRYFFQQNRGL